MVGSGLAALIALIAMLALAGGARAAETGTSSVPVSSPVTTADSGGLGNGDDNVAVAVNTKDGRQVYAVRLKIVQTGSSVVDAANAAVAAASCQDCTTVAIAIEAVMVYSDNVDTFTPVNLALAMNTDCQNCQTLAAAYQTLTQYDNRVRITGEGRQELSELRRELEKLRTQNYDVFTLAAVVDRIAGEFYRILRDDVVPVGPMAAPTPRPSSATAGTGQPSTTIPPTATGASPSSVHPTASPETSAATPTTTSDPVPTSGSPTGTTSLPAESDSSTDPNSTSSATTSPQPSPTSTP